MLRDQLGSRERSLRPGVTFKGAFLVTNFNDPEKERPTLGNKRRFKT